MLVDYQIANAIKLKQIVIEPYNRENLNPNSYDVTLANEICEIKVLDGKCIDPKLSTQENIESGNIELCSDTIGEHGYILEPNKFYLASSIEYTESHNHAPMLEGKSSLARWGMEIHRTAGFGDVGFCGTWTLEITVTLPLKVYAGMKIGQLCWMPTLGDSLPLIPYDRKKDSKYSRQKGITLSSMHENFKK